MVLSDRADGADNLVLSLTRARHEAVPSCRSILHLPLPWSTYQVAGSYFFFFILKYIRLSNHCLYISMNTKCLWTHAGLEFNQWCCSFPALAPCHVNLHSNSKITLLIPRRCHQCSCDSEGWSNTYIFTVGVLISFTREVLSKIKGIVNLVNKSLLESAGCN